MVGLIPLEVRFGLSAICQETDFSYFPVKVNSFLYVQRFWNVFLYLLKEITDIDTLNEQFRFYHDPKSVVKPP